MFAERSIISKQHVSRLPSRSLSRASARSPSCAPSWQPPSAAAHQPSTPPADSQTSDASPTVVEKASTFARNDFQPPFSTPSSDVPSSSSPKDTDKTPQESSNAPKTVTDKIVIAVVVLGILAFAVFQIRECILAHDNPSTKSAVEPVPRTYPGLMICPYSVDFNKQNGVCPRWSADAVLQYDLPYDVTLLSNSNVHLASKRTAAACPFNNIANYPGQENSGNALFFGYFSYEKNLQVPFTQKVNVKNSAGATLKCETDRNSFNCKNAQDAVTFPFLCPSWTPPNVECTVFDPNYFDKQSRLFGMDPMCNPLKETVPNSLDSVGFSFPVWLDPNDASRMTPNSGYRYSGLIPQPNPPTFRQTFKNLPTNLFAHPSALTFQTGLGTNANLSIFAGVVAVLYDASKGLPTTLNFDNARDSSMSTEILSSTILLHTDCSYVANRVFCPQEKIPPVDTLMTAQVDFTFSNKVAQTLINKTTYSVAKQPSTKRPPCLNWDSPTCRADLRLFFTSSSTIVNTQIINLSILTTVSIILSTAGTLWGSQEKIKNGIALVKAKLCAKEQNSGVPNLQQA